MEELKYKDITEKIIGASFEVHKFLGNGFQEVIYQRALAWEMKQAGLNFVREIEQNIFYKELPEPIGTRRADFVVEGSVLVELKALAGIEEVHLAQALNYLKAYRLEIGLLINFGAKSLGFKRLIRTNKKSA
jgi:GxxExxY protein